MVRLVTYRTDEGARAALVGEPARKFMPVLMMDGGMLSVQKTPIEQERYMRELGPVRPKHLKIFRSYGRRFGITSTAREFLKAIEV